VRNSVDIWPTIALGRKTVLGLLVFVPAVADLAVATFLNTGFWYQLIPGLYYACIVIAGLELGWRSGFGLALIAGITHAIIAGFLLASPFNQLGPQALAFLVVGFALIEERKRLGQRVKTVPTILTPGGQPQECLAEVSAIASELLREVRTPFASIEGAAFMVGEGPNTRDKRDEFVGIIMNECKRVDGILSELKETTEIVPLACRSTDASSMLGEVIRLAAMEHPDPAISLRLEVSSDLPALWCDPVRIQQAIVPFVASAMQAMHDGGEILLAADRQNGQGRIQVRVLGHTVRGSDPASGRGFYSSTFDAPSGLQILAARLTALQHGGTITLDQTGYLKKLVCLTLPLYNGQTS